MVRTRYDLKLDFPILDEAGRRRAVGRIQQLATGQATRRVVRPVRPTLARDTGTLRRSLRARRPRRRRAGRQGAFTAVRYLFVYYMHFQSGRQSGATWLATRESIGSETGEIIAEAVAQAIEEGL